MNPCNFSNTFLGKKVTKAEKELEFFVAFVCSACLSVTGATTKLLQCLVDTYTLTQAGVQGQEEPAFQFVFASRTCLSGTEASEMLSQNPHAYCHTLKSQKYKKRLLVPRRRRLQGMLVRHWRDLIALVLQESTLDHLFRISSRKT